MYEQSAAVYDLVYSHKDWAAEADWVRTAIRAHCRDASTLLVVACGTGRHLLRDTDDATTSIDRRVGYANASALGVAFARVHGIRPTEHRREARAAADRLGVRSAARKASRS